MTKVFIDGSAGTTGLKIAHRLGERRDIRLLRLSEELRKDTGARKDAMDAADVVFLCLPDAAALEAAKLPENPATVVIDTSTVHRTAPDWAYGFPELTGRRERIQAAKRIANPGCHASGFIALVAPLVERGVLSPDARLSAFSLTGYSGGGKTMIAEYEQPERDALLDAPRQYALGQKHKHLPEMAAQCGLASAPVFCPIVAPYFAGMEVTVPLFRSDISCDASALPELYRDYYRGGLVRVGDASDEKGFLSAGAYAGRDDMEIVVSGNDERILLISRFDNLGKGACGAAIQNMNLVLGCDEAEGLCIG